MVVYFTNFQHQGFINHSDVAPFQDLVLDLNPGENVDLMIQSPGGDIDVAEKLIYMLRQRAKGLRVIVAESAKSAATMMALAADSIVMSTTSELGPIDPQITITTFEGKEVTRPARSFLDGLEEIKKAVVRDGGHLNPAYFPLLNQYDPALLDYCQKTIARSKQFAQKWLTSFMLKADPPKAKSIAETLTDPGNYGSHGMMIDHKEASGLGLEIEYLEPDDPLWQLIWRLHLTYEVSLRRQGIAKVFESRKVSLYA